MEKLLSFIPQALAACQYIPAYLAIDSDSGE